MTHPPEPANSGYTPLASTPDTSGQFALASMVNPPRRKLWPWITAALVILALVAGAAAWFISRPGPAPASSTSLTLSSAAAACQEQVKERLKAPGTAKFGGEDYSTTNTTMPVRVSGWVDAENGFGALVRNRYSCLATPTEHGWSISEATFSEW